MNFIDLDKYLPIKSRDQLLKFWGAAFEYRKQHRTIERDLAHYIFVHTIAARSTIKDYDNQLDSVCYEFGALEAPGQSDDPSIGPEDYADQLWERLEGIVNKIEN